MGVAGRMKWNGVCQALSMAGRKSNQQAGLGLCVLRTSTGPAGVSAARAPGRGGAELRPLLCPESVVGRAARDGKEAAWRHGFAARGSSLRREKHSRKGSPVPGSGGTLKQGKRLGQVSQSVGDLLCQNQLCAFWVLPPILKWEGPWPTHLLVLALPPMPTPGTELVRKYTFEK